MPAKSKAQKTAMCMALAARKGDLEVSKLKGAALEIYNSDMTNKEIEEFTVMESLQTYINKNMKNLVEYILESSQELKIERELEDLAKKHKYDTNIYGTIVGSDDDKHTTWIAINLKEPWQDVEGGDIVLNVINRTVNSVGDNAYLKVSAKAQKLWKEVESIGYNNVKDAHEAALKYIEEFDKILK